MAKNPANDGELLYELVEKQCTLEAIQDVLRDYRPLSKDIRVTAENKHEVVTRNLRLAVDGRIVPIERVWNLVRDSEENGSQHILCYQPRTQAISQKMQDGNAIATQLWGERWQSTEGFPKLREAPPSRPEWCDFRISEVGWVAKMYTSAVRYEAVGEEQEVGIDPEDGATIYQRRFKRIVERAVLLARWRKHGLLEMRVPTWTSRRTIEEMLAVLWKACRSAFEIGDFKEWSLTPCCTRMIREFASHRAVYEFSDTLVRDSGKGTVACSTLDEEETLYDVIERQRALEILLKPKKNSCERLIVNFLKRDPPNEALSGNLRVVLSAHEPYELVIGAKTTESAVTYVINRLRQFA